MIGCWRACEVDTGILDTLSSHFTRVKSTLKERSHSTVYRRIAPSRTGRGRGSRMTSSSGHDLAGVPFQGAAFHVPPVPHSAPAPERPTLTSRPRRAERAKPS
jgi:hypothetical protein